jgi:hypothetical protein
LGSFVILLIILASLLAEKEKLGFNEMIKFTLTFLVIVLSFTLALIFGLICKKAFWKKRKEITKVYSRD